MRARHVVMECAIVVGLFLGLPWLLEGTGPQDSRGMAPSGTAAPGTAYIRHDDDRWLLLDSDGDGRVDCLSVPPQSRFFGFSAYVYPGTKGCRGPSLFARNMPGHIREELTRVLELKSHLKLETAFADHRDSAHVACLRSVFRPELVIAARPGATCPGDLGRDPPAVDWDMVDRMGEHEAVILSWLDSEQQD